MISNWLAGRLLARRPWRQLASDSGRQFGMMTDARTDIDWRAFSVKRGEDLGAIGTERAGWYSGGPGSGEGFDLVIVSGEQDVGDVHEQGEDMAVETVVDEAGVAGELIGAIVEHGPGAAVEGLASVGLEQGGIESHPGAAGAPATEVPVAYSSATRPGMA
jgi:hypothetical protein